MLIFEAVMQVAKWGNSLAVRLPKKLVDKLGLKAGDEVEIVDAAKGLLALEKNDRRADALARMKARAWTLPADYKFDRDEANER
jgi:antitoxin MazE